MVTSTAILLFDPISGAMQTLATFAALAKTLPTTLDTFPTQVISAALSTNPDRTFVYGIADSGSSQAYYYYDARKADSTRLLHGGRSQAAAPRQRRRRRLLGHGRPVPHGRRMPTSLRSSRIPSAPPISAAMRSIPKPASSTLRSSLVFTASTGTASTASAPAGGAAAPPVLSILDAENLLVKESFSIPENITGRSVLSAAQ